jgi:hypothetical protein
MIFAYSYHKTHYKAEGMAQVVEHLANKPKALSSNSSNKQKQNKTKGTLGINKTNTNHQ